MKKADLEKMYQDLESSILEIKKDASAAGIEAELTLSKKTSENLCQFSFFIRIKRFEK